MLWTKLVAATVACGIATVAHSAVITRNSLNYPVGADLTTAWPGVTLNVISNSGSPIYSPAVSPPIVAVCGYGGCTGLSPTNNFAGNLYGAMNYRTCYDRGRLGLTSSLCTQNWRVLEAVFDQPTDFVEFSTSWNSDAPAVYAYDAAGNEIQVCVPGFPLGSTATCMVSVEVPSWRHVGQIRVATASPIIKRVVVGTPSGNSTALAMQYSCLSKGCALRFTP